MALADSVPGVSGGTIAFIMGFYDRFITSLSDIIHGGKAKRKKSLQFLIKLGIGWIIGMVLAVTVLANVFTSSIYQISSLFLGFVLASLPLIVYEERKALLGNYKYIIFALLGIALVVGLSLLNLSSTVQNLGFTFATSVYVLIAGILAISAMVLPGISGSTILMTFGLYVPVITGLKNLLHLDFSSLWLIIIFGVGVLVGIIFVLRGLKELLAKYHSQMMYTILGMMIGSLFAIVRGPSTLKEPQPIMTLSTFHVWFFILGCALVAGLFAVKTWINKKETKKSKIKRR